MTKEDLGKTSIGLQANVAALLCYVLGWISGLIIFLIEKENKFVRFHGLQSVIVFAGLNLISIILAFTIIVPIIVMFLSLALWIILMITAYQGKKIKIPIAGEIAEKHV
jgi:uncharacterized membrane protein